MASDESGGTSALAGEAVTASARLGEPDRYLAALLAPPSARAHLLALAAFSSELTRVPLLVTREPAMGAIRLQWWRDALEAPDTGALTGNPIADAVRDAAHRCDLPAPLLLDVIDAREVDLAAQAMADDGALRVYLWKSEGALFALGAGVLHRESSFSSFDVRAAAAACGQAYGLTRLLLGLPHALSRGRLPLPQSRLDAANVSSQELLSGDSGSKTADLLAGFYAEARKYLATSRQHVANLPRQMRLAFLPLALVETYLRALERPGRHVLRAPAEIAPLTRVCRIAAAHWLGRI